MGMGHNGLPANFYYKLIKSKFSGDMSVKNNNIEHKPTAFNSSFTENLLPVFVPALLTHQSARCSSACYGYLHWYLHC